MLLRVIPCLLLLAAAPAVRATERVERLDFPAPSGVSLKLDTYRGGIDVRDSADGQIHVEIHEDPGTDEPAEMARILSGLRLERKREGALISVVIRNPDETGARFVWEENRKINLSYAIRVPQACNLDLATNDGGVSVDAPTTIVGRMAVRARKGTVFFRFIDGDIAAAVDTGDLVVSRCTGAVNLKAYVGNIRVGTVGGDATLRTTNGDIDFQHALGAVNASAEAGEITLGLPKTFDRDSTVKTDGGAITVRIDPAAHCSVQASSVWGRVHTALPFAVESGGGGRKTLVGRLNGGGALLMLHANGGQVRIDAPRI